MWQIVVLRPEPDNNNLMSAVFDLNITFFFRHAVAKIFVIITIIHLVYYCFMQMHAEGNNGNLWLCRTSDCALSGGKIPPREKLTTCS